MGWSWYLRGCSWIQQPSQQTKKDHDDDNDEAEEDEDEV